MDYPELPGLQVDQAKLQVDYCEIHLDYSELLEVRGILSDYFE